MVNKHLIFSILIFLLTVFIFAPLTAYLDNYVELEETFKYFIKNIILVIIIFSGIYFLLINLPDKISEKMSSLIIVLTFIIVIIGNFIDYHIGPFNGKDINWGKYEIQTILEIVIIGIVLLYSQIFYKKIFQIIPKLFLFLLIVQFGICSVSFINLINEDLIKEKQAKRAVKDTRYTFSKSNNILILVLDDYDNEEFNSILQSKEAKYYANIFKDFTYYPKAIGGYPYTKYSVPLIQSGVFFNEKDSFENQKNKNLKYFLQNKLKERKYFEDFNTTVIYNLNLNKLTYIKYSPFILKKIYLKSLKKSGKTVHADKVFYNNFDKNKTFINEPVYKYLHLTGIHYPDVMDKNLSFSKTATRSTTAYAELKIVDKILSELKNQKVYDNSLIFVIADHGHDTFIFEDGIHRRPLFLMKNFGEIHHNMKISENDISHQDIANTILDIENKPLNPNGVSILKSQNNSSRIFKYCDYTPSLKISDFKCYSIQNGKVIGEIK